MKNLKKIFAVILVLSMIICTNIAASATDDTTTAAPTTIDEAYTAAKKAVDDLELTSSIQSAEDASNAIMSKVRKSFGDAEVKATWDEQISYFPAINGIKDLIDPVNGAAAGVIKITMGDKSKKLIIGKDIIGQLEKRDYTVSEKDEFYIMDGALLSYEGSAEKVVIPEGVKEIDQYCFMKNEDIKALVIPEGVKEIATTQFEGMTALECVVMPDSLTNLASPGNVNESGYCFKNCPNLKYVRFSNQLTEIPAGIFYGCGLENVVIPSGTTFIGNYAFFGNQLKNVIVPANVQAVGMGAFGGMASLESLTFLNNTISFKYDLGDSDPVNLLLDEKQVVKIRAAANSTAKEVCSRSGQPGISVAFEEYTQTLADATVAAQVAINSIKFTSATKSSDLMNIVKGYVNNPDITVVWDEGYMFDGENAEGTIALQDESNTLIVHMARAKAETDTADSSATGKDTTSGKSSQGTNDSSKMTIIIIIVIAAALLIAAIVIVILLLSKNKAAAPETQEAVGETKEEKTEENSEDGNQ